jgi:hypothetical protein
LNSVISESNRNFRNKKREIFKENLISFKQTVKTKVSESYRQA